MPFRSPSSRAPGAFVLALLGLAVAGCDGDTTTTVVDDSSSSAALFFRLADFLGDVPCSSAPGAMRSYVATLVDRTRSDICGDGACVAPETLESCARDCGTPATCGDGVCAGAGDDAADTCPVDCGGTVPAVFTLPSSLPTSCSQGVRFDDVVGGHRYSVLVDGYESFAGEIGPPGWEVAATKYTALRSGSRHVVDEDGEPVLPRWLGACGDGLDERTIVADTGATQVLTCAPLEDTAADLPETAILVDPRSALGALSCAEDAPEGEPGVATFDITSENGLGSLLGLPCSTALAPQKYTQQLADGQTVTFFVAAHAIKDGPVTWGATCSAVVKAGLTVETACIPLSDKGSIHVDMAAVLDESNFACGGDITTYDAALTGPGLSLAEKGVPCEEELTFAPLAAGEYSAELSVPAPDQGTLFSATCTATVEPGRSVVADCTAN